jgi:hypothetical protein
MNKIRMSIFVAGAALALAAGVHAQTSIQNITISLVGEFQTNVFVVNGVGTNSATNAIPWSAELSQIHPVLVTTFGVRRALEYDLEGTDYGVWAGAQLVREVNLTNGNEGIFLLLGDKQTNVSRFFDGSFSNNFMAELTNAFPALTNNISGLTNDIMAFTNSATTNITIPQTLLNRGWLYRPNIATTTNVTNALLTTAGVYFISLNTSNIKFNLVGVGDGAVTHVAGSVDGAASEAPINSEYLGCAGTYYLNLATNIFDTGTNAPRFVTGPMHGTFVTGPPHFSPIPGP